MGGNGGRIIKGPGGTILKPRFDNHPMRGAGTDHASHHPPPQGRVPEDPRRVTKVVRGKHAKQTKTGWGKKYKGSETRTCLLVRGVLGPAPPARPPSLLFMPEEETPEEKDSTSPPLPLKIGHLPVGVWECVWALSEPALGKISNV